ncbi:MAG: GGDEF domain-containing protein, partial [Alphaproteobacteria bacterium]|nr:GGDEF domain-containing protein [Alphaproteobacteria bacterium]
MPNKQKQTTETMVGSKIIEKSRQLTDKTLSKINQLSMRSSPQFYELWYRYFDNDPELVRAIENHEGEIDESTCQKIYNRYLSTNVHDNAILKVNNQVQSSIADLAHTLGSAKLATSEYGKSLNDLTGKLPKDMDIKELGNLVSGMLRDTKKMVKKNQELETQLDNSSKRVRELKEYLESAKKEATTDGLTGISNRRAFDKQITADIEEAEIGKTPLVLLMIDIDFFKQFNDTYGHQIGDQVLRLVARTLVGNIKGRDTVARYGGEEFAILLPSTPIKAGCHVAEMLRQGVENKELI